VLLLGTFLIQISLKRKRIVTWVVVQNVTRNFLSNNEDVVWASKAALARVLNGDYIPIVQQKIIDVGFDNVRVLPRGGDNVVLFCPDKEDMMSVYLEAADFFNCFFSDIRASG